MVYLPNLQTGGDEVSSTAIDSIHQGAARVSRYSIDRDGHKANLNILSDTQDADPMVEAG